MSFIPSMILAIVASVLSIASLALSIDLYRRFRKLVLINSSGCGSPVDEEEIYSSLDDGVYRRGSKSLFMSVKSISHIGDRAVVFVASNYEEGLIDLYSGIGLKNVDVIFLKCDRGSCSGVAGELYRMLGVGGNDIVVLYERDRFIRLRTDHDKIPRTILMEKNIERMIEKLLRHLENN